MNIRNALDVLKQSVRWIITRHWRIIFRNYYAYCRNLFIIRYRNFATFPGAYKEPQRKHRGNPREYLESLRHYYASLISRFRAIQIRMKPAAVLFIEKAADFLMFNLYLTLAKITPKRNEVQSVLQLSIISHQQFMISRLLTAHGVKSKFLAINNDLAPNLNIGYDYALPSNLDPFYRRLLQTYYLWAVAARYDVIHIHFSAWLTNTGREFEYFKKLGKVVVFHFRGCDLRQKSVNNAINPELNCCQECEYPSGSCENQEQRMKLATAMKYGDLFFLTTPDLGDFIKEGQHIPFLSPTAMDIDSIESSPKEPGIFRIVTSSNHHGIDGTKYVREAVKRLREEGKPVELVEVHNMPYRKAIGVYKSADLFVGKLRMGYYNNANIELMSFGVPNMSYIREKYLPIVPDCPIIVTRPDNAYEKIKEWMDKPDELKAVGAKGPAFTKKYHDPDMVTDIMISKYNGAWKKKRRIA